MSLNYISVINRNATNDGGQVVLHCENKELIENVKNLGADPLISGDWSIGCSDKKQLASVMVGLRDLGICFVGGPAGWPPAAVFEELREHGLVDGQYKEIIWFGENKIEILTK